MSNVRNILLRHIRLDGGTQARAKMDQAAIDEYAEAMEAGASFPAVVVFEDHISQFLWLGDGFHRVAAAEAAGKKNIKAEIREGGLREARLFAIGANVTHGVRRSNGDKRMAVSLLLDDPEWGAWSNREIARVAGVSEFLVRDMREEKVRLNRTQGEDRVPTVGTPTEEKPAPEPQKQAASAQVQPSTAQETHLSPEDQVKFAEMLINPPEPAPALAKAFERRGEIAQQTAPVIPLQAAPLPPRPDDRDIRIKQLEKLVEGKDAEIAELTRKLEEAGAQVQELNEESQTMHRILDAEDLLTSFKNEVTRAQALARTTEERFRGIQNQNKALAKSAASWKRKFEALERKTKGAPEPDPELEDECPYPPEAV